MLNLKSQISNLKSETKDTDAPIDNSTTHSTQRECGATNSERISITPKAGSIRPKLFSKLGITVICILLIILPFVVVNSIFQRAGINNYKEAVKSFIFSEYTKIGSQDGRINILILGVRGKGHEGAELTDTMIFASVSLTDHSITLVSIPRDIWIPEIRAKINSAYYWGNIQPERGDGPSFAKETVSKVLGQTINYALLIDFSGFQDLIDTVGGINVVIDRSFTDSKYPVAGLEDDLCNGDKTLSCRYKTIHFDTGIVHMDGTTALEFVRSREGDNEENTDFARSARQQKVISAVSTKLLSINTILNPFKDYKILIAIKNSIKTDMDAEALGVLARTVLSSRKDINSSILSTDLLISPPISSKYDKQYVLIPKLGNGKWEEIQKWVESVFKN